MVKTPVKAVAFDLDGTLLDTLVSLANCYNRVLSANELKNHEVSAYRYFIGNGAMKCLTACLETSGELSNLTSAQIEQLHLEQQADYRANWDRDVEIYPGINKLLNTLRDKGLPLAVLTNKDQEFAEQCIARFFAPQQFLCTQGFSASVPHKPNPTGALKLSKTFGLVPEQVALIGDTAVDIETAKAAGFVSVGVLWGFREQQELEQAGADFIIEHPDELLELPIF